MQRLGHQAEQKKARWKRVALHEFAKAMSIVTEKPSLNNETKKV